MIELLIVFITVFVANMLPIFGPPTWMVLSIFTLTYNLPLFEVVILGAIASTSGRFILASYISPLSDRFLPRKQKKGMNHLRNFLKYEDGIVPFLISFIYSISPLPSNAIFIIAGAAHLRLASILSGFFLGRILSYGLIVGTAKALVSTNNLFSPAYILLDAVGIGLAVGILFADWGKIIQHLIEREKRRRTENAVKEVYK